MGPRRLARAAGAVLATVAALAGCSARTAAAPAAAPPAASPPLATALATGGTTWVDVPMGELTQPSNTFWQLFVLTAGGRTWRLVTPPGVADNGGLVLAEAGPGTLVVGFRPSARLAFSPLATTADDGRTYTTGLVPQGLAARPDALAAAVGTGRQAALTGSGAGVLLTGAGGSWRMRTDAAALARTGAGRACGVLSLTAVAYSGTRVELGAACGRPGVVGIFASAGSGFRLAGPALPAGLSGGRVQVLRLLRTGLGLAALLRVSAGGRVDELAAWSKTGGAPWSLSPALRPPGTLTSTALLPGGDLAVLSRSGAGGSAPWAAVVSPGAGGWTQLPEPPAGTATVAGSAGRLDAIVVSSDRFLDYRLRAGRWRLVQREKVPIQLGSSG